MLLWREIGWQTWWERFRKPFFPVSCLRIRSSITIPITLKGTLDDIDQTADGQLLFSNPEIQLQGYPLPPDGPNNSIFKYTNGVAWLSTSNNPRVAVIKFKGL